MRRLVPHASVVGEQNANSLQKAVVNAMTLDHDQTATEFVRNYILEKNNMKVGELRESIRTYRNINETIKTMREKLEALLALRLVVDELAGAHERKACEQWIAKRGSWFAARAAYAAQVARFTDESAKRDAAKAELGFFDEELKGIEAEISRLERAIAEHDAKTGRNSIVQLLATAAQTAQRSTAAFERRLVSVRALQPLCAMKGYGFDEFIPFVSGLTRAAKEAAINRSTIVLLNEESRILSVDRSVLDKVDEARRGLIRQAEDEKTKARELRDRLQRHSTGGGSVYLEPATVVLCQKLRQAGMAPRVLCDLVEVADVAWTAAAEGKLHAFTHGTSSPSLLRRTSPKCWPRSRGGVRRPL
jgi:hypothetical protein